MLIECIGLPGSGKTTTALALAKHVSDVRIRAGVVRRFQFRVGRLLRRFRSTRTDFFPELWAVACEATDDDAGRARWYRGLVWRAEVAKSYQARHGRMISDELLVQGLFTALGPRSDPDDRVSRLVESAIVSTYRPSGVRFVYVDPPPERLIAQVKKRRRGRSRFDRSTSPDLLQALKEDRLYSQTIVPSLERHGFTVMRLRDPMNGIGEVAGSLSATS